MTLFMDRKILPILPRVNGVAQRVQSLDGVRALAVITVILCHLVQRFAVVPRALPVIDGVQMFFVLSGFLITSLLLREQQRTGTIALPSFYTRRALRILPPLFVYLLVAALLCHGTGQPVPWGAMGSAALLLTGLDPAFGSFLTDHLWSLAVEEQFYLLWPLLLMGALRWGGKRRAAWLALLLIGASPLLRTLMWLVHSPLLAHKQAVLLPGRMDSLFAGSLAALCMGTARFEALYSRVRRFPWVSPLFFALLSPLLRILGGSAYTFTCGYTLEALCETAFLVWLIRSPESVAARVLGAKPLAFLGTISYSLYLYQSALIHNWHSMRWNGSVPGVLAAVFAAGLGSYFLVEVPAMRRRSRQREQGAAPFRLTETQCPALMVSSRTASK